VQVSAEAAANLVALITSTGLVPVMPGAPA